jgi:hypothetical protein
MQRMLWLLQAVPHLPNGTPIYITVQQPAGIPDWIKIVISAAVGAVFGGGTSVLMEFVKPSISKRQLKKGMVVHLIAEAMDALQAIEACQRIFSAVEDVERSGAVALAFAEFQLHDHFGERYEHYFNEQKIATHEIDRQMLLRTFYAELRGLRNSLSEHRYSFQVIHAIISSVSRLGYDVLKDLGAPPFRSRQSAMEERYLGLIAGDSRK